MIEIRNLCAGYGEKEVLHQVNVVFCPGKVTALIGPNGCGKSTLLKSLVRINPHTSGQIYVHGTPIQELSSTQLARQVAYLPQSKKTPDISVLRMVLHGRFAHLSYPRRYRAEDMEIARKALRWAGMEHLAEENVSRLSGGMQQKVYIAMALAQDADTILMDEPTTYLDVAHQLKLMDMAKQLASEGKAVVMVLHDLSQALRTADEVVVLKDGVVLQEGTPDQVFASGNLQAAFGVKVDRHGVENGWHYYCEL